MAKSDCINVLIVDDHPMVRGGLKSFILAYDWMEPVWKYVSEAGWPLLHEKQDDRSFLHE